MLNFATQTALWILAGSLVSSASYAARRDFDAVAIDGTDVPYDLFVPSKVRFNTTGICRTTTDFAAPQTTDSNSDIATAYRSYIQACGMDLQQANQEAVGAYNDQFKTNPADPNAPSFIAWAYSNVPFYQGSYQACENRENAYQNSLATLVPDTPSATKSAVDISPSPTVASQPENSGGPNRPAPSKPSGSSHSYALQLILLSIAVFTVPLLCC